MPLGEAIKQLPKQYLRVLTRPSVATFAEEKQKAAWNIIWVQVAFIAIIGALISFATYAFVLPTFLSLFNPPKIGTTSFVDIYKGMALQGSLTALFSTPISLFISWTIYYFIAKLFKGRGEFIEYIYSSLLFYVPIQIISGLLMLIPFVGLFLSFAVSIYTYVLMILMTMAVHRLSGGRATLAVLILPIIAFVLGIIGGALLIAMFIALASSAAH
ncbi:YIP1 family protein [Dictyobacter sp. S3.2.2.5]|uniref:YIP1 family protein n=1 Tax=Dictyobacter halimunensis TaxID=3026934 RepID=A0ABQ6FSY9_9CHLR|nr:YIP1 family protein [Dictyobacter sp. S3.2.2.5]